MQSIPWYRSPRNIVLVSVLCIVVLGVLYFLLSRAGLLPSIFVGNPNTPDMEAHYSELERHRAEQRQAFQAADPDVAPQAADNSSAESPNNANSSAAEAATKPAAAKASRAYWTDYRGPNRDGRYDELKIRTNWSSEGPPLLWRAPVGGGYASFVVAGGRAFTIEQRRRQEVVAAYDIETGRELWIHSWDAEFKESMGGDGPRATPTWHEGRLYALGATGELRCLEEKTGKLIWSRSILKENGAQNLPWGMAGSPLIVDDKVIVLPGGSSGKSVVAYNKLTGEPIWKALNDRQAYVSPMLVTLAGRRQILVVSSNRAVGLAVEDGALLWEYPWTTSMGINCSQPIVVSENRFFISSGYGKGAALVELSKSGSGFTARTVWGNVYLKNKINSSVFYDGHIYGLDDPGILTCIDVETGERKWKGGRYGLGQVLLVDGHLIVTTDKGELVLVRATPDKHEEVGRFSALEDNGDKSWNYPALAGSRLLVRNSLEMACYNIAGN